MSRTRSRVDGSAARSDAISDPRQAAILAQRGQGDLGLDDGVSAVHRRSSWPETVGSIRGHWVI